MASRRFVHLDAVELTTGLRRRRLSSDPPARAEVARRAARDPCARPPPRVERLAAEDDVVEVLPGARGVPVVPRRVPLARPGRSVDGERLPVELARVAGAGPAQHGVGLLVRGPRMPPDHGPGCGHLRAAIERRDRFDLRRQPHAERVEQVAPAPVREFGLSPRHRRDVVPVGASARWRGGSRRSTQYFSG